MQVEYPENIRIDDKFLIMRWYFRSYNFTLTVIWTPFLIKSLENKVEGAPNPSVGHIPSETLAERNLREEQHLQRSSVSSLIHGVFLSDCWGD